MPEARVWSDALGFVPEMLPNEDCDAVGSARIEEDAELDSKFRLLGFEEVVAEARY